MGTYDAEEQRARNERGCVLPVCYGLQNKLTTGWSALDRDVAAYRPRIPIPVPVPFDVRGHRRAPRSAFPLRRASWPAACPAGRTMENPVSGARRYGSVGMYIPDTYRAAWRWRWRGRGEDEQVAGRTPPAPRGSLTNGGRVLAGVVLFSLAVVLRSDPA
jgi:hypothetical protein